MKRRSTLAIPLLAGAAFILPSEAANAQYYSFGISVGGGTTVAAHMGIHLGNTDRPRWSLSRGSYGWRTVPTDGTGSAHEWRFHVPWPQLQVYLSHSGGFNWT